MQTSTSAGSRRTLIDAASALRAGTLTSRQLVEESLAAIEARNPELHAFIRVDAAGARAAADRADADLRAGSDHGALHGLPISLKDLIDVAGEPTTAASAVLADSVAKTDAPIVTRLRSAGAVLIGKTNMHEFALGTTSEDTAFGAVRHPADPSRSAGGSSGGSAVAVATGMGLASVGSDTGGSIRIPSACCGLVGLKPPFGEVSTSGVVPLSTSLDHIGPIARSVADAGLLWAILTGLVHPPTIEADVCGRRLRRLAGYFDLMAPEVRAAFDAATASLERAGAIVDRTEITGTEAITTTYVNIALPEAAAWHAKYLDARADQYTPPVRARLESGRTILAVDYVDAKRMQQRLREAVDAALEGADALVLPTLPILAPPQGAAEVAIGTTPQDRIAVRTAMLRNTQLFNISGHPAISLPLRVTGLPVGLQLVGRSGDTPGLLEIASACEKIVC